MLMFIKLYQQIAIKADSDDIFQNIYQGFLSSFDPDILMTTCPYYKDGSY